MCQRECHHICSDGTCDRNEGRCLQGVSFILHYITQLLIVYDQDFCKLNQNIFITVQWCNKKNANDNYLFGINQNSFQVRENLIVIKVIFVF